MKGRKKKEIHFYSFPWGPPRDLTWHQRTTRQLVCERGVTDTLYLSENRKRPPSSSDRGIGSKNKVRLVDKGLSDPEKIFSEFKTFSSPLGLQWLKSRLSSSRISKKEEKTPPWGNGGWRIYGNWWVRRRGVKPSVGTLSLSQGKGRWTTLCPSAWTGGYVPETTGPTVTRASR